jgi:hypothetical protein
MVSTFAGIMILSIKEFEASQGSICVLIIILKIIITGPGVMVHACNLSYSGIRSRRIII